MHLGEFISTSAINFPAFIGVYCCRKGGMLYSSVGSVLKADVMRQHTTLKGAPSVNGLFSKM